MNEQQLNHKIKTAFTHAVPDALDGILAADADAAAGAAQILPAPQPKTLRWPRRLAALAACLALLVGGALGVGGYRARYAVASTISLDVNPSIQITANRRQRVLEVQPLNADGAAVVGDMDFSGSSVDVTVNALIGSMLRQGYLSEAANSVLISVQGDSALQQRLTQEVADCLQTGGLDGAVLSQTLPAADDALRRQAEAYGITTGKAQLINAILAQDAGKTFAGLAALSINELNLLAARAPLANIDLSGQASDKAYIGVERARQIALAHAGLAEATFGESELDSEDGVMVYEVEFFADGYEYDYTVDAASGDILKAEKDRDDDRPATGTPPAGSPSTTTPSATDTPSTGDNTGNASTVTPPATISAESARQAALAHAGLADATFTKTELDNENGVMVYEVEFFAGGYEYDYTVDAASGDILKAEKDWDD